MYNLKNTVIRAAKSRWLVIAVSIWIQCVGGASYDFSVYSQRLKTNLNYNQQELDTVSFFKDIGANVGIVSGLLYDALLPWIVLAIAAVLGFFGYFMTWLSISQKIATPTLWQMCIYMCLAANSQTFSSTATVVTCVKIFPKNRGTVVGLMKGVIGLSGAVLVQLYYAIYANNQSSFVLLVSWLIPAVCIAFMFIIRPLPVFENGNEKKWLDRISLIALVLATYLLGITILEHFVTSGRLWSLGKCFGILFILLLPLWVALKAALESGESTLVPSESQPLLYKTGHKRVNRSCESVPIDTSAGRSGSTPQENMIVGQQTSSLGIVLPPQEVSCVEEDGLSIYSCSRSNNYTDNAWWKVCLQAKPKLERGENFTLLEAVQAADFWILFFATACGMGSGLTTINNMSQIGSSQGYTPTEVATLVSLWSIWNFLGRFGAGYVSECFLHSKGIARPLFISVTLAAMGVGHLTIGAALPGALYFGSILVGVCYGAQWSLMPTTTSELFGLQHFGTLFNTVAIASPLGSYLLSVKLAGYLYDLEARKGHSFVHFRSLLLRLNMSLPPSSCYGSHCFRLTFFIMAAVCFSGFIASSWLFVRTKTFYKVQVYQRLNHGED